LKLFLIKKINYFQDKGYSPFIQNPVDGTGGALKQFYKKNNKYDYYLVILSDTPVFDYKIISDFLNKSVKTNSDISVLSQNISNPNGYGRLILQIIKNLSELLKRMTVMLIQKKINLINTGIFMISKRAISNINLIKKNSNKKEFYITDLIDICNQ
jgi:bifunctional UDP-N-acetylglucosamine pyrophosphorylase/glucosamine-1-phosphate N-acetyltransferase